MYALHAPGGSAPRREPRAAGRAGTEGPPAPSQALHSPSPPSHPAATAEPARSQNQLPELLSARAERAAPEEISQYLMIEESPARPASQVTNVPVRSAPRNEWAARLRVLAQTPCPRNFGLILERLPRSQRCLPFPRCQQEPRHSGTSAFACCHSYSNSAAFRSGMAIYSLCSF